MDFLYINFYNLFVSYYLVILGGIYFIFILNLGVDFLRMFFFVCIERGF